MIKRFYTLLISSLLFFSCRNEVIEPGNDILGSQFFPIKVGYEFTYDVEEINYRNTGEIDTSRYQLVDQIEDSSLLSTGIRYEGYRLKREVSGTESVLSGISFLINQNTVIQQIGNKQEVILSFPVQEDKSWNGALGASESDEFTYQNLFKSYSLSDSIIEKSVQVIEENNMDSLEFLDTRIKVYGAGLGLLSELSSQIEFCTLSECFGLKEITFGKTVRKERVIE